jgi:hypothetical protein
MKRHDLEDPVRRLSRVDTEALPSDGGERYNRLIFSRSPYLLQHAENPIDWYCWGEEAFARARNEDKPLFLSIGYSTCHWCHVMAHESFENREVAEVLNRHFVAIKVDREERPDIDGTYMTVCQMMTGSGGWPLNLILAPDKKPFFAATYIPKNARQGMIGLIDLLKKVAELWLTDRDRLLQTGEEVGRALLRMELGSGGKMAIDDAPLNTAYEQYLNTFDRRHAGFGTPKFPAPHNLSLLLRLWQRTGKEEARIMALQTLQHIRLGGIFDQIGFGVHRYAVDSGWLVPHFEKMLYDQALAVIAYLDAFQATGDGFYAQTAKEVIEYVMRDLSHPAGGFYCGEDADSEGAEGTFYLWTPRQVMAVLGEEMGTVFCRSNDITEEGNFEGKSIPHLEEDLETLARRVQVPLEQLSAVLGEGRLRLLRARNDRIRPHRDDKVLTGWNGLAIAALARAGAILEEERFTGAAQKAAAFILERLRSEKGRLLRRYRQEEAAVPAFLEDYTFFVWGLIELYQAGFDSRHLQTAVELTAQMEELFGDGQGSFFDTGGDAETVIIRGRSLQDGAIPSGSSVAALNLLRLGRLTGDTQLETRGEALLQNGLVQASRHPSAHAQFLIALDYALGPKTEIVLAIGRDSGTAAEMLRAIRSRFLPRTVVMQRRAGEDDSALPLLRGKEPLNGKTTVYLCRDQTCREPVTTTKKLEELLRESSADTEPAETGG